MPGHRLSPAVVSGICHLLIQLLIRAGATVDLVEHLAVPDEKHPACMARRLDRMRHHEDRLPAVVDRREQPQHLIR